MAAVRAADARLKLNNPLGSISGARNKRVDVSEPPVNFLPREHPFYIVKNRIRNAKSFDSGHPAFNEFLVGDCDDNSFVLSFGGSLDKIKAKLVPAIGRGSPGVPYIDVCV